VIKTENLEIVAKDGHKLGIYVASPEGEPKGAILVLQEIFGVNEHIRSVCDRLAKDGYVAAAPALFDRIKRGHQTGYQPEDIQAGMAMLTDFSFDAALDDIEAGVAHLAQNGKVSILGFCIGGSLAYLAATRLDAIASASCYYGGRIADFADENPRCPVQMHYGELDPSIPPENVATVRAKQPDLPVFVYPAGHGFNCDARGAYEPESAAIAWKRTMEMFVVASGR
jgi:carboxymethylenebutenolidase